MLDNTKWLCFLLHVWTQVQSKRLSHQIAEADETDMFVGRGNTYRVLSYNICWGCMEGDPRDKTGMVSNLRTKCLQNIGIKGSVGQNGIGGKITKCARNIGNAVEQFYKESGGYDLMAFQEASNFGDLGLIERGVIAPTNGSGVRGNGGVMKRVQVGAPMPFVHETGIHKGQPKKAWLVSLYNERRLGQHDVHIADVLRSDRGRPYLILIFDSPGLIFINLHNTHPPHGKHKDVGASWNKWSQEMHENLAESFRAKPDRQYYRVIAAGDFNDLKGRLPGCVVLPWNGARLQLTLPLPNSCCDGKLGRRPRFMGDYIFDSESPAYNFIPASYQSDVAHSDHWPVEAVLTPVPQELVGQEHLSRCIPIPDEDEHTSSSRGSRDIGSSRGSRDTSSRNPAQNETERSRRGSGDIGSSLGSQKRLLRLSHQQTNTRTNSKSKAETQRGSQRRSQSPERNLIKAKSKAGTQRSLQQQSNSRGSQRRIVRKTHQLTKPQTKTKSISKTQGTSKTLAKMIRTSSRKRKPKR